MSVSLRSVESIVDTANRFYQKDAPLIYSHNYHIPLLLNIIGYVNHEPRFPVVITTVPLIEPIIALEKTVILSKSLIAFYMNQPIKIDHGTVKFEHNVDLFDDLHEDVSNKRPSGCLRPNPKDTLVERFDENTHVRFAHIVKLVMLVAHWQQHLSRSIPYSDHSNFRQIELASRESAKRYDEHQIVKRVAYDLDSSSSSGSSSDDIEDADSDGDITDKYNQSPAAKLFKAKKPTKRWV